MVDPSKRQKGKNAPSIKYPDIPSSIAPVPHTIDMPVPQPPLRDESFMTDASSTDSEMEQSSAACFQLRARENGRGRELACRPKCIKKNTTFLALLRLFYALESTK